MSQVGEVYDDGTIRLEVVVSAAESDGQLHEMRATYAAGSPLPPAHLHPDQDERFEVHEGALRFLLDDEEHVVEAGHGIDIPRGTVHQVHNPGEVPAVASWQTRPALRTGEFHASLDATRRAEDWDGLLATLRDFPDVFRMVPDPFAEQTDH